MSRRNSILRVIKDVTAIVITPPKYEIPKEVTDAITKQCGNLIIVRGRQRAMQRNLGLKLAKTKYVLMVDTDEIITPNYVETLLSRMKDNVAVSFGINVPHYSLPKLAKLEEYFKCVVNFQTGMQGGRLYIRKVAIDAGGFKVVARELGDFPGEFLKRIRRKGHKLAFEPKAVVYHLNVYTLRKLVKAGLSAPGTKYNPLYRLYARIFTVLIRVFQHYKKVYEASPDHLIFLLPIYAPLRQLLFSICATVRKFA